MTEPQNQSIPIQAPAANTTDNNGTNNNEVKSEGTKANEEYTKAQKEGTKEKPTSENATPGSEESSLTDLSSMTPDDSNDEDYGTSKRKRKAGGTPGTNKRARAQE